MTSSPLQTSTPPPPSTSPKSSASPPSSSQPPAAHPSPTPVDESWLADLHAPRFFDFTAALNVPLPAPNDPQNPPLDDAAYESDEETRSFFTHLVLNPQRHRTPHPQTRPPVPPDIRNPGPPLQPHRPSTPFDALLARHSAETPASTTPVRTRPVSAPARPRTPRLPSRLPARAARAKQLPSRAPSGNTRTSPTTAPSPSPSTSPAIAPAQTPTEGAACRAPRRIVNKHTGSAGGSAGLSGIPTARPLNTGGSAGGSAGLSAIPTVRPPTLGGSASGSAGQSSIPTIRPLTKGASAGGSAGLSGIPTTRPLAITAITASGGVSPGVSNIPAVQPSPSTGHRPRPQSVRSPSQPSGLLSPRPSALPSPRISTLQSPRSSLLLSPRPSALRSPRPSVLSPRPSAIPSPRIAEPTSPRTRGDASVMTPRSRPKSIAASPLVARRVAAAPRPRSERLRGTAAGSSGNEPSLADLLSAENDRVLKERRRKWSARQKALESDRARLRAFEGVNAQARERAAVSFTATEQNRDGEKTIEQISEQEYEQMQEQTQEQRKEQETGQEQKTGGPSGERADENEYDEKEVSRGNLNELNNIIVRVGGGKENNDTEIVGRRRDLGRVPAVKKQKAVQKSRSQFGTGEKRATERKTMRPVETRSRRLFGQVVKENVSNIDRRGLQGLRARNNKGTTNPHAEVGNSLDKNGKAPTATGRAGRAGKTKTTQPVLSDRIKERAKQKRLERQLEADLESLLTQHNERVQGIRRQRVGANG